MSESNQAMLLVLIGIFVIEFGIVVSEVMKIGAGIRSFLDSLDSAEAEEAIEGIKSLRVLNGIHSQLQTLIKK